MFVYILPSSQDFSVSALILLTWPIALIGGILGRHLYNTRQDAE